MPRKPRYFLPGIPVHAVQRGNNREAVFFEDEDYFEYLKILKKSADEQKCEVHAYVLMTNHIHLLLTPTGTDSVSGLFQAIGRHYVPYINKKYQRSGGLWEGRFKASMIDSSQYLLTCMRYIELNPLRAGMVCKPEQYRWSSYHFNALGISNPIITPHDEYTGLVKAVEERLALYREMVEHGNVANDVQDIRKTLQTGTPLGSDKFLNQIESMLGKKVGYSQRGRPRKIRSERNCF